MRLLALLALGLAACGEPAPVPASGVPGSGEGGDPAGPVTLRVVRPAEGDLVGGLLEVVVEVSSAAILLGVEFHLDGRRMDTALVEPFTGRIDTTRVGDGPRRLEVIAADADGHTASETRELVVDNTPPAVRFLEPIPDLPVYFDGRGVDVAFEVTDDSGLSELDLRVNGLPVEVEEGEPCRGRVQLEDLQLTEDDLPFQLVVEVRAVDACLQETTRVARFEVLPRLSWSHQTGGVVWKRPTVGRDGTLHVGSRDGVLTALGPEGNVLWTFSAGAPVMTDPALGLDGRVYVGAGRAVVAVDAGGTQLWRTGAGGEVGSSPALSPNGRWLYVGTYDWAVLGLDVEDGELLWEFETDGEVLSSPAVAASGVVYVGSHDTRLYALGPEGWSDWFFPTAGEVWGSPLVTRTGRVVFGSNDEYVYSLSAFGTKVWEIHVRGGVWGRPAEGPDGTLYVGSTSRRLYALTPGGDVLWRAETGGLTSSGPVVDAAGTVYVGSTDGKLYAIGPEGQVRWTFRTEGPIHGSPALSPDQLLVYVGSQDRRLYALRTGIEAQPACPAPEMVSLGDFEVMAYEASRLDARSDEEGELDSGVCSRAGVRPWTRVTWEEAQAACGSAGMELCARVRWERACHGVDESDFPYGPRPSPTLCNGGNHPESGCEGGACRPRPTGGLEGCVGPSGAHDMSGNVWEWTGDDSPLFGPDQAVIRGGSFRTAGDELRCTFDEFDQTHVVKETRRDDLGFRCCRRR